MSVSVCAGWKYCSITISPLACSFWLVLNVCCGKASAGDAGKCKPKSALSCGSAMRVLVFSWANTVAPAACRLALLSVWLTCQCVDKQFAAMTLDIATELVHYVPPFQRRRRIRVDPYL